jgi:acyl-CoA synthetase (AMP-forming)/AMP-acid ligase II
MAYNIADLYEHTADAVPDRLALIDRDTRLTFAQLDERANRVAHALAERGVGAGDHVGIYAQNSHEWVETMLGAFKLRAVPININFRYVEEELAYLLGNADCVACVYDRQYAGRLAAVRDRSPGLETLLWIDDGTTGPAEGESFDEAVAVADPTRTGFGERSGDDLYVLYTGGTTGMPKGVMWRQEDVYMALGQGIDSVTGERVTSEYTMAERAAAGGPMVFLVIPPLMHGAAQWGTLGQMLQGHTIVLLPKFSAEAAWQTIHDERVNSALITGDAMGRPMIEHLLEDPSRYDTSSLIALSSSAAIFSPTVKDQFLEVFPNLIITDSIGSSESGFNGLRMVAKGQTQMQGGPTVTPGPDVAILDENLEIIPPTSTQVGKLGRTGNIPLGYYKDDAKTAATFVTAADGRRYAMGGDFARWEPDGTLTLLGRGSTTINSGGEKIHPEEVEQALKSHPAVFDCLVVGVPDERWGQKVAAVVQFRPGTSATLDELADHARATVAGYKVPRELHVVEEIERSPSGKPDYPWAANVARGDR